MTRTTLSGFGMADDLDFGRLAVRSASRQSSPAASASARSRSSMASSRPTQQEHVEVVNLMWRRGQRQARHQRARSTPCASHDHQHVHLRRRGRRRHGHSSHGFDWDAQGFLPGQTVTISGVRRHVDRSPRSPMTTRATHATTRPASHRPTLPTGSSLSRPSPPPTPRSPRPAPSRVAPHRARAGTITRTGGNWTTDGFQVGQLVMIIGARTAELAADQHLGRRQQRPGAPRRRAHLRHNHQNGLRPRPARRADRRSRRRQQRAGAPDEDGLAGNTSTASTGTTGSRTATPSARACRSKRRTAARGVIVGIRRSPSFVPSVPVPEAAATNSEMLLSGPAIPPGNNVPRTVARRRAAQDERSRGRHDDRHQQPDAHCRGTWAADGFSVGQKVLDLRPRRSVHRGRA